MFGAIGKDVACGRAAADVNAAGAGGIGGSAATTVAGCEDSPGASPVASPFDGGVSGAGGAGGGATTSIWIVTVTTLLLLAPS
jgi:hypothetical protein